jgi:Cullin family
MWRVQGNMVLKAPFKPQAKELVVMPYQVALLMLFNESDVLSFEEIRDRLKLTDDDTLRTLGSLACAKHAILLVEGWDPKKRPKKLNKTDCFRVNWNFQDKLVRCSSTPTPSYLNVAMQSTGCVNSGARCSEGS